MRRPRVTSKKEPSPLCPPTFYKPKKTRTSSFERLQGCFLWGDGAIGTEKGTEKCEVWELDAFLVVLGI